MTIALMHSNPVRMQDGLLKVDRKFHIGMQSYVRGIPHPLTTVNPLLRDGQTIMDAVDVPISELAYSVVVVEVDKAQRVRPHEVPRVRDLMRRCRLVYGTGLSSSKIAHALGIPYIPVLEYDLQTQITVATSDVRSFARRVVRSARSLWNYATEAISEMRAAHSVHCNGYPMYDTACRHNANCLLYLDSRMSADMIISASELGARLADRAARPLRLLYSGRYERLKGADDAVRVAVECLRRGLDVEMHCYGQGSLRQKMEDIARAAVRPDRIHIHGPVAYPELVRISRTFDVFVCCHIQNDPSCTYLESLGAGLTIVGYANRMWRRLSEESGAGLVSAMGRPEKVADDVARLSDSAGNLPALSERAVAFARLHCFEREFQKRVDAINAATT